MCIELVGVRSFGCRVGFGFGDREPEGKPLSHYEVYTPTPILGQQPAKKRLRDQGSSGLRVFGYRVLGCG